MNVIGTTENRTQLHLYRKFPDRFSYNVIPIRLYQPQKIIQHFHNIAVLNFLSV